MKQFICAILCVAACATPVGYTQGTPEDHHTMARPTVLPSWATNLNYAGGINVGTPTKIAPSAGRIADGWRNTEVPPAQQQNYEMSLLGDWINWFDSGNTIGLSGLPTITSAVDGSKVYVSDAGWYQYHAATVYTADGLRVITATGMGVGQWVHQSVIWEQISTIPFTSFANLAARTTAARTYVSEIGWYDWHATNVATADNVWVVTATGIGSGQWVHEHWTFARLTAAGLPGIATVGPLPGEGFTTFTAPGRLNKQLIDHGYYTHMMVAATDLNTTSAALVEVQNITLGNLFANDIIKAHLPAIGACTVPFQVAVFLSQDNGATYTHVSPGTVFTYPGNVGPLPIVVQLDFNWQFVPASGIAKVSIRIANSDGATNCLLSLGSGMIEVIRP